MKLWPRALALVALLFAATGADAVTAEDLARLSLPPGFKIELYARVPGARSIAPAPELDAIFVGTRGASLYAVFDRNRDFSADAVELVGNAFKLANGVAWKDGWLYLAEQHRVTRWRPRAGALAPTNVEVLADRIPDKSHHGWRYAAIGPDERLYVALGAPCNICEVSGLEGTIVRMGLDGAGFEVFARGVRNSVGIDFHPSSGEAWFTDNGGDNMGDDSPPDELNRAPRPGLHFGYPHFAGGRDVSPAWRGRAPPEDAVFPEVAFGAHVAALGLRFYRGAMFPPEYRGSIFVAQHGSWNRSVPDGYRVVRVVLDTAGRAVRVEPFIEGWLQGGRVSGRPVDIKELADGSLLVSDDRAGAIYRVTYRAP